MGKLMGGARPSMMIRRYNWGNLKVAVEHIVGDGAKFLTILTMFLPVLELDVRMVREFPTLLRLRIRASDNRCVSHVHMVKVGMPPIASTQWRH